MYLMKQNLDLGSFVFTPSTAPPSAVVVAAPKAASPTEPSLPSPVPSFAASAPQDAAQSKPKHDYPVFELKPPAQPSVSSHAANSSGGASETSRNRTEMRQLHDHNKELAKLRKLQNAARLEQKKAKDARRELDKMQESINEQKASLRAREQDIEEERLELEARRMECEEMSRQERETKTKEWEVTLAERLKLLDNTQIAFDNKKRDIQYEKDELKKAEADLRRREAEFKAQEERLGQEKQQFEEYKRSEEASLAARSQQADDRERHITAETVSLPGGLAVKKKRKAAVESPEKKADEDTPTTQAMDTADCDSSAALTFGSSTPSQPVLAEENQGSVASDGNDSEENTNEEKPAGDT